MTGLPGHSATTTPTAPPGDTDPPTTDGSPHHRHRTFALVADRSRSASDEILIVTYNLRDYRRTGGDDEDRYGQVEQVLRDVGPHVALIQEGPGDGWSTAARGLVKLADATGMQCLVSVGRGGIRPAYAAAPGGHDRLGLGIMWRPGIDPLPDTYHVISGTALWHGLVMITLDVGGHKLVAATYHAPPRRGRDRRRSEATFVAGMLAAASNGREIWLGADWNSISARTVPGGGYYDPDPAQGVTDADRDRWHDNPPEIAYPH